MRDQVLLYLNGQRISVDPEDSLLSLSDFLRDRQKLVGTKIVCSEGDCGACTVLIGRPRGERLVYQAVDSCIQFMFQLDGAHVVSVEGLQREGQLTAVQQAMVDCHGSQCGFCTPGFVAAMTGILEESSRLDEAGMRYGLTGNLCRCTGYTPIVEAGEAVATADHHRLEEFYPSPPMLVEFAELAKESVLLQCKVAGQTHQIFIPQALDEALDFLVVHPDALVVAGGTDIGVRINKTREVAETILDLNRLAELESVTLEGDHLQLGARASWTAIEEVCRTAIPQFHEIVSLFGSPQIRNVGTLGGNLINASPIADSLPFLHVMHAQIELAAKAGTRRVDINDFYQSYKRFDLLPGELLTSVQVPLPAEDELLKLYKVSRRRDLDISSFTAAIRMRVTGNTISSAKIAYGAVGPTIIRPEQTEQFLAGKAFTEETMLQAGDLAVSEISPISDVRGSADYRRQLARNVLLKFYYQQQPTVLVA